VRHGRYPEDAVQRFSDPYTNGFPWLTGEREFAVLHWSVEEQMACGFHL
jgi:hypothetical protein